MPADFITIKGAREHNLKNIDLALPKNKLIVITGISGSGKSTLAFDTLYAEGQRRYVESLSSYARQFLEQMEKPDVEYIEGLSPAIAIEQRSAGANPRSTVGTTTEIYDYLRVLFARIGRPHCYKCGRPISAQSAQEIIEQIMKLPADTKFSILAPLVRGRKGEYKDVLLKVRKEGFARVRVDGRPYELSQQIQLDKDKKHNIEIIVDRLTMQPSIKPRLADSVETALVAGKGLVIIDDGKKAALFSEQFGCAVCGINYGELEPRIFSFNSPYGACPACNGLGRKLEVDPDLVIKDKAKSIRDGAIEPWWRFGRTVTFYYRGLLRELAQERNFSIDTPFKDLNKNIKDIILYGSDDIIWGKRFEGVIPNLERRFHETESDVVKEEINRYMSDLACPACLGARLRPESLAVTIEGKSIYDVTNMPVISAYEFFNSLKLTEREKTISHQALKEIRARLNFLKNVGLGYLTLERRSSTLSGGEAQRIRLATQIGSGLVGVLYILDEPSIGLHQRDNSKLLDTLKALRDLGNTLIVVEHDEATIRSADYIVDLGPGAGKLGGEVVACGSPSEIVNSVDSLTGKYLRGELVIPTPAERRVKGRKFLKIEGAAEHNLKKIDVEIPLGLFTCVSGVSGSGKSTLVYEILYPALAKMLYDSKTKPGAHKSISGAANIDKAIVIDQSPIGRTPRSNPATYTGLFSYIRDLFAMLPDSRVRGFKPGRFSFNVKGGRCEACEGDGTKKIEMHFLPDVYVRCEVCKGARFNEQTLQVKYKGYSIADVLAMSVDSAKALFENIPRIREKLATLADVGLGYIELGQSATTLSGGEAQRVKLSTELSKRATGRTLYILDEPTTGLHFADIDKLLSVLHRLVGQGNTVLVIEHNLDVIKTADYIIDLGPEGGDEGGRIVATGTPEELAANKNSYTGQYLKKVLKIMTNDKAQNSK